MGRLVQATRQEVVHVTGVCFPCRRSQHAVGVDAHHGRMWCGVVAHEWAKVVAHGRECTWRREKGRLLFGRSGGVLACHALVEVDDASVAVTAKLQEGGVVEQRRVIFPAGQWKA